MRNRVVIIWCVCIANFGVIVAQKCGGSIYKKQCNDGACIDSDLFCDGSVDCKDGSDETGEHCLKPACPEFAFRCTYGGCISRKNKCDGKIDCADKSDENALLCGYPTTNRIVEPGMFQCDSGQRINLDNTCDGKKDCDDGSDETTEYCTVVECPSWVFRCAYGGCISKNLTCNGVNDCADGADEYKSICGENAVVIAPISTSTTTEIIVVMPQNGCQIPYVANLIVVFDAGVEEVLEPGSYVEEFVTVRYKCKPNHLLEGETTNFCHDRQWLTKQPICIKYCQSSPLKGVTFSASCEFKGTRISCDQPLRTGTIARISCQVGYRKPDRIVQEILYCDDQGDWDYSPFRCEPVCGVEQTRTIPFILGGDIVNITSVPWHAAIYLYRGFYEQICGGTILNAKIIVSAAHCFWDVTQKRAVNHTYIAVGVGKYFRDYNANEPLQAQFFNVSEIRIADGYQDSLQAYQNDIALLVLNRFIEFNSYIKPICLEWLVYSEKGIKTGTVGRIAGWGTTGVEMKPSTELRLLEAPAISYPDCLNQVDVQFRTSIASDKFCLGSANEETSCGGDSGGGFVAPKLIDGIMVYFLWGVVSNGLTTTSSCVGNFYTTYTNIQYHSSMIRQYEAAYRPK